jgi:hypothetical protein
MAHPDLNDLLDPLFSFAQEMLAKRSEFFPFGASMSRDGTIALTAGQTDVDHPSSQQIIDLLVQGFQQAAAANTIRACAICLDVRCIPPGVVKSVDALCARLEHSTGEAVEVYLPYRKGWTGKFSYGEVFATPGQRVIFPGSQHPA